MWIVDSIYGHQLDILVDSGSTHNFIHSSIVKRANLPIDTSTPLWVRIANDDLLQCGGHCKKQPIKIQGNLFSSSCYVLPLGGCDMVLGVSWLSTLGPIVWDFSQLTMEFSWKTHKISLKGIGVGGLTVGSSERVRRQGIVVAINFYMCTASP